MPGILGWFLVVKFSLCQLKAYIKRMLLLCKLKSLQFLQHLFQ
jgi:hypothetical protein